MRVGGQAFQKGCLRLMDAQTKARRRGAARPRRPRRLRPRCSYQLQTAHAGRPDRARGVMGAPRAAQGGDVVPDAGFLWRRGAAGWRRFWARWEGKAKVVLYADEQVSWRP